MPLYVKTPNEWPRQVNDVFFMFGKSCHGCLLWLSVNQKTIKLASLTDKSSPQANKISFVYQPVFLFTDIPLILLIFPNLSAVWKSSAGIFLADFKLGTSKAQFTPTKQLKCNSAGCLEGFNDLSRYLPPTTQPKVHCGLGFGHFLQYETKNKEWERNCAINECFTMQVRCSR